MSYMRVIQLNLQLPTCVASDATQNAERLQQIRALHDLSWQRVQELVLSALLNTIGAETCLLSHEITRATCFSLFARSNGINYAFG
jgi:hypothetical protein